MHRKGLIVFAIIYLLMTVIFVRTLVSEEDNSHIFTAMCLENSLPCMDFSDSEEYSETKKNEKIKNEKKSLEEATRNLKPVKNSDAPQVLIYHTHATESYLPETKGNYHVVAETNTVRDVGNALEKSLEEAGIKVIHDKTLHDHPSYDGSYGRSSETISQILAKYPSISLIIDLHRDAIPSNYEGDVYSAFGKNCATYSYVISNVEAGYQSNLQLVQNMNAIANQKYEGYTGKVIERGYSYNQELCKNALLIEMGNNRNNIEDARAGAEVLGKIMAEALL